MRALVTGGAGFIGSQLVKELVSEGHQVLVVDDFSAGHQDNLSGVKAEILTHDLERPLALEGDLDVIFHQAAITDPRFADDDMLMRKNLVGFDNIVALAKEKDARLIYASSASLYGNGPAPQREDQEPDLLSVYAESKHRIDGKALELAKAMPIIGLRYFNVFGPGEEHKGRPASMVYHLIRQLKAGKHPRLFRHGEQRRDHIYVKDVVAANLAAIKAQPGIYNVGTGVATSFTDLLALIQEVLGTDLEVEWIDNPYEGTYQNHTQADTTLAEERLGFAARCALKEAIEEFAQTL